MFVANHPAILPPDIQNLSDNVPISRPLDPELSKHNISLDRAADSIEFKVKDTIYQVSFISEWANGLTAPARPIAAPSYFESKEFAVSQITQVGNTCGPTSLTMVLKSFGIGATLENIIARTHCSSYIGTSPVHLRECAKSFGLNASIVNDASSDDVVEFLNKGARCIAITEVSGSLHYVVINGFRKSRDQGTEFLITDPNGNQYYTPLGEFCKEWKSPSFKGISTGLNQCVIAISKEPIATERFGGLSSFLSHGQALLNRTSDIAWAAAALLLLAIPIRNKKRGITDSRR